MKVTDYRFFHKLETLPFIDKIWLYGSRARKDSRERSDIDLAIECPNATYADWQKVVDIIENADTLLKIDCIKLDDLKDTGFKENLFHDKQLLFQKRRGSMTDARWKRNFDDLGKALERLKEALEEPIDKKRLNMDAAIHRFEFCIELFWKSFKNFLEREGRQVLSPRNAVAQAYQMQLFDNETLWLQMLDDRNAMSHHYEQNSADEIYARIQTYYPEMQTIYDKMKVTNLSFG